MLIAVRNVLTTGQPSMHLLAVSAVEHNQTEPAIQITDIFRHLKNLTACTIYAAKTDLLK